MADKKQINDTIEAIKRLQTFNGIGMLRGIRTIPKEVGGVQIKSTKLRQTSFISTSITLKDEEALKKLDTGKLRKIDPKLAKAVDIIKRIDFSPEIIDEVVNYLPSGMLDMSLGGVAANTGININFNCKRLPEGGYWPVALEEIETFRIPSESFINKGIIK